jgi:hypothetical protein
LRGPARTSGPGRLPWALPSPLLRLNGPGAELRGGTHGTWRSLVSAPAFGLSRNLRCGSATNNRIMLRVHGGYVAVLTGHVWHLANGFCCRRWARPCRRAPLQGMALSTDSGASSPREPDGLGRSVEVLLRVYAKCLDGGDALVRRRVEAALVHADVDIGTERGHEEGHRYTTGPGRTRPDAAGHTTRPLTFIRQGQRPWCAGTRW